MSIGLRSVRRMVGSGDTVNKILFTYWFPELITQFIFITLPPMIDSYLVASLRSTTMYGALGTANNFLHLLLKFSEAIPIASVAIIGRHNGSKKFTQCGKDLGDTFWTSAFFGFLQFGIIFFAASSIYRLLGVPESMVSLGTPFLRLRSFGILLVFVSISLVYFMRAIKNTRTPMIISIIGVFSFVFFDYALVLGKFGFPRLGLYGSAISVIIQYSLVIVISIGYLFTNKDCKKYFQKAFFGHFSTKRALHLLNLSWQVMIDKTSLAMSYIFLFKLITPIGEYAITSFDVIKNLERFAFLPAVAFAQIVTFLVSNKLGAKDPEGAKSNIKKVLILSLIFTSISLFALCIKAHWFVGLFDPTGKFTHMAAPALVLVSTLVIFDFLQLILAGSLRGAGDVRTVMRIRFLSCLFFFVPFSYFISKLPITNPTTRFALIYSTFYINAAVIGFFFLRRILSDKWQKIKI